MAKDLIEFVEQTVSTISDRRFRGIAGFSMGGYGAIALAIKYPSLFSVATSLSGVLDLPKLYHTAGKEAVFGKQSENRAFWMANNPVDLAPALLQEGRPPLKSLRFMTFNICPPNVPGSEWHVLSEIGLA